jgi:DNA-nicking Smr family endonuclease
MRDVVPLEPDPRGRVRSVAPISPPLHSPQGTEHADVTDNDFVAQGVDRREIRKLKRGEYIVRDRRDLHGMTAADALAR